MRAGKEITYITVAGKSIHALKAVCPVCHTLDLGTGFDTRKEIWKATCSQGHTWEIDTREN